jgi:hypothetical protein
LETVFQKKPLCSNQQGKNSELKLLQNIGSRKHAVSSAHSSSACLLQQRAGLKGYFANSSP